MNHICKTLCVALLFALQTSCGGDTEQAEAEPMFSGTVSSVAALAQQQVFIKPMSGDVITADIDSDGSFQLPTAMQDDQYLMRVDLGNDNFLYSIAHLTNATVNRQNIHSYTDLAVRTWFADQGIDINVGFASRASLDNFPTADVFRAIDANIQAIISDVLEVYGLSEINLSSTDYEANDTGVDRFLNENPVIIKNNRATIIVNDPNTNMQSTAVNRVALQTTFGEIDTTPPQMPTGLRANGTSDSEIVLSWTTATDNIGVASYLIYRNDELIGHTPYPLYTDSNLQPQMSHQYVVVAEDEAGNQSQPTDAVSAEILDAVDNESPASPSRASVEGSTQEIRLSWSHVNTADIARFEVTRDGEDGILVREVTSARINDINVASGTEYCYSIVAIDASGNRSESNQRSCFTTSGANVVANDESTASLATVNMAQESVSGVEGTTVTAYVTRDGTGDGEISVVYSINAGTAIANEDYLANGGTLTWADGDLVTKQIDIELLYDNLVEDTETLYIALTASSPNAVIANSQTSISIFDN